MSGTNNLRPFEKKPSFFIAASNLTHSLFLVSTSSHVEKSERRRARSCEDWLLYCLKPHHFIRPVFLKNTLCLWVSLTIKSKVSPTIATFPFRLSFFFVLFKKSHAQWEENRIEEKQRVGMRLVARKPQIGIFEIISRRGRA